MNRLILCFFMLVLLMGCSSKSSDSNVSIREFDSESRSNSSFSLAEAASSQGSSKDKFVSSVSTDVNIETKSKVFCEPGKQLDAKIILSQIFLLPAGADSSGHTFLYRDGEVLSAYHEFREDDVIGIDIFQDINENNNQDDDLGEYIRMSDIPLFSDTFQFSETVLGSVSYVFPIGSTELNPTVSITGCWMQLTLDFK